MIVDIITYTDASFTRSFVFETAELSAVDLTGAELRMHVRAKAADVTTFIELSSTDVMVDQGITVTDPPAGKFTVKISYSVLSRLPVGDYEHSLIAKLADGVTRDEVWRGKLSHLAGATRWSE